MLRTRFEDTRAMLQGITRYGSEHPGWTVVHDDQARAAADPRCLAQSRWAGVISRHTSPDLAAACRALALPLVDLEDGPLHPGVPKVRPDNVAAGRLGAEHFLERGFKHFGFAGFSSATWSRERCEGFRDTLAHSGFACAMHEVPYVDDTMAAWDPTQLEDLRAWLRMLPKPCGIMACFDFRAIQVLDAARAEGLLVPEELAVLGCNDDRIRCEMAHPALSSVALDAMQAGYRAAATLFRMIAGGQSPVPEERILPLGVLTRLSTDILAIDDPSVATAIRIIREHAARDISVTEVARLSHASRSILEKRFRRTLGRSPQAEIRRMQIQRVRQILVETDYPLKRIAALTGFGHVEYLCVVFKRLTGETPGAYRRRARPSGFAPARSALSPAV